MKRKILIYGDSNVWGYGSNGDQLPLEDRWPSILQEKIGNDYEIIAKGESGRVAGNLEDVASPLNGPASFEATVKEAEPLDMVMVALGTNDLKRKFHQSAQQITTSLLWYETSLKVLPGNDNVQLIYILPPNFAFREGGMSDEIRRETISLMEREVGVKRCIVAHDLDLSEDGLHLSVRGHIQLAEIVHRFIPQTQLSNAS